MDEKYSRLFNLQQCLYSESSPVIITTGTLLKDNQSGKVLVQLKLQNVSDKAIKAVTVSIVPLDTAGRPLGNPVSYQYLDLNAQRGDNFAQKSPVVLPDASTRAFSVTVEEVIFADNSVWNGSGKIWEAIESPKSLDELGDAELIKQFKLKYGAESKNMLSEQKDIWFCTCGCMNYSGEAECRRCGNKLDELRKLDMAELETAKAERLAIEKKTKRKKKITFGIIGITLIALVLLVITIVHQIQADEIYESLLGKTFSESYYADDGIDRIVFLEDGSVYEYSIIVCTKYVYNPTIGNTIQHPTGGVSYCKYTYDSFSVHIDLFGNVTIEFHDGLCQSWDEKIHGKIDEEVDLSDYHYSKYDYIDESVFDTTPDRETKYSIDISGIIKENDDGSRSLCSGHSCYDLDTDEEQ